MVSEREPERFNTSGEAERDCPICYRAGSLTGLRNGDAPVLTCNGCRNRFRLTWADGIGGANTLERLGGVAPARPYTAVTGGRR